MLKSPFNTPNPIRGGGGVSVGNVSPTKTPGAWGRLGNNIWGGEALRLVAMPIISVRKGKDRITSHDKIQDRDWKRNGKGTGKLELLLYRYPYAPAENYSCIVNSSRSPKTYKGPLQKKLFWPKRYT